MYMIIAIMTARCHIAFTCPWQPTQHRQPYELPSLYASFTPLGRQSTGRVLDAIELAAAYLYVSIADHVHYSR